MTCRAWKGNVGPKISCMFSLDALHTLPSINVMRWKAMDKFGLFKALLRKQRGAGGQKNPLEAPHNAIAHR